MPLPIPYNTGLTEEQIAEAFRRAINDMTDEQIAALLAEKVDKQEGFSLMSEADKSKLDGLENYDDADMKADIGEISNQAAINKSTLECQRKNLLKNMATSQTINGVTFTVNEDKTVTANGTATANALLTINNNITKNSLFDFIILTGCPNGGGYSKFALGMEFIKNGALVNTIESYGSAREYKIEDIDHDMCNAYVKIWKNQTVNNLTFKPMLRSAEITDDTYEPYKPSVAEELNKLQIKRTTITGTISSSGNIELTGLLYDNAIVISVTEQKTTGDYKKIYIPWINNDKWFASVMYATHKDDQPVGETEVVVYYYGLT